MTHDDTQILMTSIQRYIKGEHPHSQYEVAQLQRIWRELHR